MNKGIFLFLLWLMPFLLQSQQEITFNYLKDRFGKIDMTIYLETVNGKKAIETQEDIELVTSDQDMVLVFELNNLRLGYERESKLLKKPRDRENFFVEIPQNPENITMSSKGVKLLSLSNEGRLADSKSSKINKTVEIKYALLNKSPQTLQQDIYIRFFTNAFEGKVQIRPSERGGNTIRKTVKLKPNPNVVQRQKAWEVYNQVLDTSVAMEARRNYYNVYMEHFSSIDQKWTEDLVNWKNELFGNVKNQNQESILFNRIQRAYDIGNYSLTYDFCREYDERMITEPEIITGRYLPDVLYFGILSSANNQRKQKNEWLNRIRTLYPTYSKLSELPKNTSPTERSFVDRSGNTSTSVPLEFDDSLSFSVDSLIAEDSIKHFAEVEELEPLDFTTFNEEDEGQIIVHDNEHELTLQTSGISPVYIVNFHQQKTKKLIANPSFKGEERRLDLHDLQLTNGEYIVSLTNRNGLKLDEEIISFRSRKLSAELKYILGLSSLLLLYGAYRKYFAL